MDTLEDSLNDDPLVIKVLNKLKVLASVLLPCEVECITI